MSEQVKDPGQLEHEAKFDAMIDAIGGPEKLRPALPVDIADIKKALSGGDYYLNTIPLERWDAAAGRISMRSDDYRLWKDYPVAGLPMNLSYRVCMLKRAAQRLAATA